MSDIWDPDNGANGRLIESSDDGDKRDDDDDSPNGQ